MTSDHNLFYSENLHSAIQFSARTHHTQKRKSSGLAYIVHPLTVAIILARLGVSEELVIAGVLHDTVEDSDGEVTADHIAERFGNNVAELVKEVTEQDKTLSWEVRKQQALDHIPRMSKDALLLKSADVLANIIDLLEISANGPEDMWQKFNGTKEQMVLNKKNVIEAIAHAWPGNPLLPELFTHLRSLTVSNV